MIWTSGSASDDASESEEEVPESSVVGLPGRRPQGGPPSAARTRSTCPVRRLGWGLAMVGGEGVCLGAVVVWLVSGVERELCVWILDTVLGMSGVLDTLWWVAVRGG